MFSVKVFAGAALALAITAASASAQVVVSSKIDTEGGVLGNIIQLVLNANNIKTTDRIQLGGTPVVRKAITAGEIDIYPEYTGNAAFFFEKADDPVWKDAAKAYETAKKLDYDANKIVWLSPAPANNTWAIALRKEVTDTNKLVTLSDFGKYVAGGGKVVLAASAEFVNSAAALPAFQTTYGFTLKPDQLITLSGGDTAATIAAAANQTSGANAAMVYGTDGGIAPSGLVVLEDDKGVQPVYQPAPIIRESVLKEHPEIETLLKPVFAKLDLVTLQELNGRVQVGGEPVKACRRGLPEEERLSEVGRFRRAACVARRDDRLGEGVNIRFDKLGVVIAAIAAYAAFLAPFATFRANRIVPGQARSILEALPTATGPLLLVIIVVAALIALFKTPLVLRLAASVVALVALALLIGVAGSIPDAGRQHLCAEFRRPPVSGC